MTNQKSEFTFRVSYTENKTLSAVSAEKIGTIKNMVMGKLRSEAAYVVLAGDISPGFDKVYWPLGSQAKFIGQVYNYYELERPMRYPSQEDINHSYVIFDRSKKPLENLSFRNSMNFHL